MKFENFHFFCFFKVSKGSPFNFFLKFCSRIDVKKSQSPHFTVFGIVRFFKMNNFCFEIRFSQTQHVTFCLCDFFSNFFSSKPPQFLPETKLFASIKDCSRFSPLCDLPETLIKKLFRKKYFLNFLFFERFLIEKVSFLLFPAIIRAHHTAFS